MNPATATRPGTTLPLAMRTPRGTMPALLIWPRQDCGESTMVSIDEASVDAAAPNSEAIKNGRGLVLKNKFTTLSISEDETILFGACQGSGKEPYRCSCDFARPDKPTHRC